MPTTDEVWFETVREPIHGIWCEVCRADTAMSCMMVMGRGMEIVSTWRRFICTGCGNGADFPAALMLQSEIPWRA